MTGSPGESMAETSLSPASRAGAGASRELIRSLPCRSQPTAHSPQEVVVGGNSVAPEIVRARVQVGRPGAPAGDGEEVSAGVGAPQHVLPCPGPRGSRPVLRTGKRVGPRAQPACSREDPGFPSCSLVPSVP